MAGLSSTTYLVLLFIAVVGVSVGDKMQLLWKAPKSKEYYAQLAKLAVRTEAHSIAVEQQEYERAKKYNPHWSEKQLNQYFNRHQTKSNDLGLSTSNTFKIYKPKKYSPSNQFYRNWNRDQPRVATQPAFAAPHEKNGFVSRNGYKNKPVYPKYGKNTPNKAAAAQFDAKYGNEPKPASSTSYLNGYGFERNYHDQKKISTTTTKTKSTTTRASPTTAVTTTTTAITLAPSPSPSPSKDSYALTTSFPFVAPIPVAGVLPEDSIFHEDAVVPHTRHVMPSNRRYRGVTFIDNSGSDSSDVSTATKKIETSFQPAVHRVAEQSSKPVLIHDHPRRPAEVAPKVKTPSKPAVNRPYRRPLRFKISGQSGRKITFVDLSDPNRNMSLLHGTKDSSYVEAEGVHCVHRSTTTYNRTKWICCDNSLKPRLDSWMTSCCGSQTYDPKRFICCEGNLQIKNNRKTMCCGSRTYNPESFVCCDGHLNYARKTGRSRRRRHVCCGKWTYNPKEQICCSGTINRRTKGLRSCCKTNPYNPHSHSCCNDGIRPKYQGCVAWGRRFL